MTSSKVSAKHNFNVKRNKKWFIRNDPGTKALDAVFHCGSRDSRDNLRRLLGIPVHQVGMSQPRK